MKKNSGVVANETEIHCRYFIHGCIYVAMLWCMLKSSGTLLGRRNSLRCMHRIITMLKRVFLCLIHHENQRTRICKNGMMSLEVFGQRSLVSVVRIKLMVRMNQPMYVASYCVYFILWHETEYWMEYISRKYGCHEENLRFCGEE